MAKAEALLGMGLVPERVAEMILTTRQATEAPATAVVESAKIMVPRLSEGRTAMQMPKLQMGQPIGIPLRYSGPVPEQVLKNSVALMEAAKLYLAGNDPAWPGAILHGHLGRGKTSAAVEVMRLFADSGYASMFTMLYEMVREIKQSWGTETGEKEAAAPFVRTPLLVVDEVGVQFDTEAERNILYSIIVKRHNNCLPTIMTTNDELDDKEVGLQNFLDSVGARIYNRFEGFTINSSLWGGNIRTQKKMGF